MCLNEPSLINPDPDQHSEIPVDEIFLRNDIKELIEKGFNDRYLDRWTPRATTNHGTFWFDKYDDFSQPPAILDAEIRLEGENGKREVQSVQLFYDNSNRPEETTTQNDNQINQFYIKLIKDDTGWRPEGIRIVRKLPESDVPYLLTSGNYDLPSDTFNWNATKEQKATYNLTKHTSELDTTVMNIPKSYVEEIILYAIKQSIYMLETSKKLPAFDDMIAQGFQAILAIEKHLPQR